MTDEGSSDAPPVEDAGDAATVLGGSAPAQRARVNAMPDNILPVATRAEGLRSDPAMGKSTQPLPLQSIRAPTLIVSTRDDGFGTCASAACTASQIADAKFIGFDRGGHTWVGHDDEIQAELVKLLTAPARP